MKKFLFLLLFIAFFFHNINSDYILPFSTVNIGINQTLLNEDFLSNILSRHLISNFLIGSNSDTIKAVINMSQIGFYIYENAYNYNSSSTLIKSDKIKSFYLKNSENGYDANDTLCFNEYKEKMDLNDYDIKKCKIFNSVNFELLKDYSNNPYSQYGIIGLGAQSNQDEYIVSTFIKSLKNTNMTNSHYFSFNFINDQSDGTVKGYLYIGQEEEDENIGRKNKVVSFPISGQFFWNLKFEKIHTAIYNESNSSIFENYKEFDIKTAEIIVDLPYIIGIKQYKLYIDSYFFRDLILSDICSLKKIKLDEDYSTFVCDNTSELFRKKLENEFPKLLFHHDDLNKTFILNKYDLFTYNFLNKSDTNIYFLILFSEKKGKFNPYNPSQNEIQRWKLGIPFFKKYKLIFNADSKEISYYEIFNPINNNNDDNGNMQKKQPENVSNKNINLYLYLGIGGAILLLIICFILGYLCHKNIIKLPRKKKANELDDEYEYSINPGEVDEKKASLNNFEVNN